MPYIAADRRAAPSRPAPGTSLPAVCSSPGSRCARTGPTSASYDGWCTVRPASAHGPVGDLGPRALHAAATTPSPCTCARMIVRATPSPGRRTTHAVGPRRRPDRPRGRLRRRARERCLVLGGRSEIGLAVARRLASGARVVLAARRADDLDEPERRLRNAGATAVHRVEFDADDVAGQRAVLDDVVARFGPLGAVVVAFGVLGDQARAEQDAATPSPSCTPTTSHTSPCSPTSRSCCGRQGSGTLVVFSSVAGVAGPAGELRLRVGEGGPRRVRLRAGRCARTAAGCGCCWCGPGSWSGG